MSVLSGSAGGAVHPRRLTTLVSAIIFVDMITWLAVVPLIPVWQREYDLTSTQSGVLLGAYAVAVLVFALPTGHLADRVGPRRLTLIGLLAFTVVVPALGFVEGFWPIFIVRLLQGFCSAIIWSAGLGWLAVALQGPARARSLIIANAAATTATVAGPLVGGPLVSRFGIAWTFGALGVILAVLMLWALVEPGGPVRSATLSLRESPFVAFIAARRPGLLRISLIAIGFVALVQGSLHLVGALRLDADGLSSSGIGWAFTAASAAALIALLTVNRYQSRIPIRSIFLLLPLPIGVIGLVLGLQLGIPLYIAALIVVFALSAPVFVISYVACAEGAQEQGVGEGAAFGSLNALWALGAVVSPLVAGILLARATEAAVYVFMFLVAVAAWVAIRHTFRRREALEPAPERV